MENTTRTMRELRSVAQMVKRSFHWIFLMKIQFYHVTWVQKNFFIAIFEKNRSKYIGLNRSNIGKLTKENQAFCTCPSLQIVLKRINLNQNTLETMNISHKYSNTILTWFILHRRVPRPNNYQFNQVLKPDFSFPGENLAYIFTSEYRL